MSDARAKVSLPDGGPAAMLSSHNIDTVERVDVGIVDVAFTTAFDDSYYVVSTGVYDSGGSCLVLNETVDGFRIERTDSFGTLVDADFSFEVEASS